MQSKTLIVVGMHRSGTSLVTNWLSKCGLQVGESLLGDAPSNVEGHFEDFEFLHMHEEILTSNDLPSTGLIDNKEINISIYQLEKLKSIITIKDKLYTQWGWKDPRTCLFLDTYRELIPAPKYLIITRDYQSVVNSLLKRDFSEVDQRYVNRFFLNKAIWTFFRRNRRKRNIYHGLATHYLKVWINYNRHILKFLKEIPTGDYVVVNYSLLEKCDKKIFSLLTNTWGFFLEYFSFGEVFKENLLNKPSGLDRYIKDTKLITEAEDIENAFKPYMQEC
jgi:hypothetical protein